MMLWILFCIALLLNAVCLGKAMANECSIQRSIFFGLLSIFYLGVSLYIASGGAR